jgi:D-inositol-3-phosphate glycosyltransferase
MRLRVAMLSVHTCPLAALGGKDTGGMNVYVRELTRELGRMGFAVDVFTRSQDPTIRRVVPLGHGTRVIHLPAGPEGPIPRESIYEHLEEFIDRVDGWRMANDLAYDLIHAHYWLSGTAGLALRERWGIPVLQMFHTLGRFKNGAARRLADLEPSVRLDEESRIVRQVDGLVASSVVERRALIDHYGADPGLAAVIPCGVDTDMFRPGDRDEARARIAAGDAPLVLYVGRIAPIKGLETLLAAMARLRARSARAARLLIVGGEADEPRDGHEAEIRRAVDALGLRDAVAFVGAQPQERLRDYYVAADVTVLPSYYESFGMVALEAMACGSPVIGSRVGGLATTVRDGVTGFLVRDGDDEALADRIETLVDDADLRFRLGREGVQWAARHRWPCVAEAICREYARLESRAESHLAAARCHE